jgi:hypothetical protein
MHRAGWEPHKGRQGKGAGTKLLGFRHAMLTWASRCPHFLLAILCGQGRAACLLA